MKEAAIFTSEREFRNWFEKNLSRFGVREIYLSQEACPDYIVIMEDGSYAKVEAELFAVNFKYHGHDPSKVDFIVACYSKCDSLEGVPVKAEHRLWCIDQEIIESLSPEDSLSVEEARLLADIHHSGGISLSALSDSTWGGDHQIWIRVQPEVIDSIPRCRIEDNIQNILTQESKAWVRKYHHLLIGSGLSEDCCRLLESLTRRQLIGHRPIITMEAMYDGVIVQHPAWFPVEVYTKPEAKKYHWDDIIKHIFSKNRD